LGRSAIKKCVVSIYSEPFFIFLLIVVIYVIDDMQNDPFGTSDRPYRRLEGQLINYEL
jgi:hypothetical protein